MIDSSAKYGLYNPAFSQDIGQAMLVKMSGSKIEDLDDYRLSGTQYSMNDIDIKNSLTADKFESSANKKDKIKKGIIIGVAALAALILGKKFGKNIVDLLKKIPGVKTLGASIKTGFTNLKSKFKLPDFKAWGTTLKSKIKLPDFKAWGATLKSKIKLPDFKSWGDKIKNLFKFKK